MVRLAHLKPVLAAALVFAAESVRAQSRPTLDGYRLGQTWRSAGGRTMPCHGDSYGPGSIPEKACMAANGVLLYFRDDTLVQVYMWSRDRNTNLEDLWHNEWKARTMRMFGPPDSVIDAQGPPEVPYRGIDTRWDRATWCAFLSLAYFPDSVSKNEASHKESASVVLSLYSPWRRDPKHRGC